MMLAPGIGLRLHEIQFPLGAAEAPRFVWSP